METITSFSELAECLGGTRTCLTIGVFDGLHLGHQALIRKTVDYASELGLPSVAVTFSKHPLSKLAPPYTPKTLLSNTRKKQLFEALGVDFLVMQEFTQTFADTPAQEFVTDSLLGKAAIRKLISGYDFTFGAKGQGNIGLLKEMAVSCNYDFVPVASVYHGHAEVKSTHIRDLLSGGQVQMAAEFLTRPHELAGVVTTGKKRGRTIGYPTANLRVKTEHQCPGRGVYACFARVHLGAQIYPAMVNIGVNPTFGTNEMSIEAHLFGYSGDLVGKQLSLYFLNRTRDEIRFPGVTELVKQLDLDKESVSQICESDLGERARGLIPPPVLHDLAS